MARVTTVVSVRHTYVKTVCCPGCGRSRELTARHVLRGGAEKTLCNLCRFPPRKLAPTNTERRYWLRRYSDEEIALMAEALFGACDRASIHAWRRRLNIPLP